MSPPRFLHQDQLIHKLKGNPLPGQRSFTSTSTKDGEFGDHQGLIETGARGLLLVQTYELHRHVNQGIVGCTPTGNH